MSTQRWNDDMLDRLADKVDGLADRIEGIASIAQSNSHAIENNNRLIESNARVIQALANVAAEAREEREQLFQRMDRQQAEIVGLRTETVRMLDILLNQRNQGDNPNS